ncbi:MAG: hypothetical protein A2161_11345 [Candidatus Schekmanbacteria bacterium RBG_13_48_7]|uniref:Aspartyl/glutamyl-tRNA(Asn/Gln) amidotransferase subunit C n=1 Tax=Candidatus Schekmanbacteria bacterium RBG_13_48_7 TaxID=1817878 RepID=A0A1F7S6D5_9BACT|nr:MAG: hypothetical protein A2161_11345 [Candidatus Schekmanbacteria bacterium RBG_13_48_7]
MSNDSDGKTMVSDEDIRITSELAAIEISKDEIEIFKSALEMILGHFSVLDKIGITASSSGTPVEKHCKINDARKDSMTVHDNQSFTRNAPEFEDGFFTIPRIIS